MIMLVLLLSLQRRKASVFTRVCVKSQGTGIVLEGLCAEWEREGEAGEEYFSEKVREKPIIFTSKW